MAVHDDAVEVVARGQRAAAGVPNRHPKNFARQHQKRVAGPREVAVPDAAGVVASDPLDVLRLLRLRQKTAVDRDVVRLPIVRFEKR